MGLCRPIHFDAPLKVLTKCLRNFRRSFIKFHNVILPSFKI